MLSGPHPVLPYSTDKFQGSIDPAFRPRPAPEAEITFSASTPPRPIKEVSRETPKIIPIQNLYPPPTVTSPLLPSSPRAQLLQSPRNDFKSPRNDMLKSPRDTSSTSGTMLLLTPQACRTLTTCELRDQLNLIPPVCNLKGSNSAPPITSRSTSPLNASSTAVLPTPTPSNAPPDPDMNKPCTSTYNHCNVNTSNTPPPQPPLSLMSTPRSSPLHPLLSLTQNTYVHSSPAQPSSILSPRDSAALALLYSLNANTTMNGGTNNQSNPSFNSFVTAPSTNSIPYSSPTSIATPTPVITQTSVNPTPTTPTKDTIYAAGGYSNSPAAATLPTPASLGISVSQPQNNTSSGTEMPQPTTPLKHRPVPPASSHTQVAIGHSPTVKITRKAQQNSPKLTSTPDNNRSPSPESPILQSSAPISIPASNAPTHPQRRHSTGTKFNGAHYNSAAFADPLYQAYTANPQLYFGSPPTHLTLGSPPPLIAFGSPPQHTPHWGLTPEMHNNHNSHSHSPHHFPKSAAHKPPSNNNSTTTNDTPGGGGTNKGVTCSSATVTVSLHQQQSTSEQPP
ncbi:hypothetical protein Pelo_9072 [Pelomyxa schiedti]|nr:hypothetical protein Pelo_9072 [Pelomyxa schiedti]